MVVQWDDQKKSKPMQTRARDAQLQRTTARAGENFCGFLQLFEPVSGYEDINRMKSSFPPATMKATSFLLLAALLAPVGLALGFSAALVSGVATGIALSAIALSDYRAVDRPYGATLVGKRSEIHPLAA